MAAPDAGEYLLWLGGVFDQETMLRRPGVAPSGRRTQRDLIAALGDHGIGVRTIGHVPEPVWPRGRAHEPGREPLEPGIVGDTVAYWNLPGLRSSSLSHSYRRAYGRRVERDGAPLAVLSYNAYPHNIALGSHAQEHGVPWVPIVADVPVGKAERQRHDRAVNQAAGRVFLSWAEYVDPSHQEPKLHLDHGINELRFGEDPDPDPPIVVYAGSLGPYAGVSFLVDAFRRVERNDIELWICGFGRNEDVDRAAREDPRIRFLGLVSEDRLDEVSRQASLFVNPRPSALPGNEGNFPSKLLDYLKYGRPVISTWTAGIEPRYRNVLTVLEEETPNCLARTIEEVAGWDAARRQEGADEIRTFLEEEKLWTVHVGRLIEWLQDEVGIEIRAPR